MNEKVKLANAKMTVVVFVFTYKLCLYLPRVLHSGTGSLGHFLMYSISTITMMVTQTVTLNVKVKVAHFQKVQRTRNFTHFPKLGDFEEI